MSSTNKGRKSYANMPEERPDIRVDGWTWTGSDCNLRPHMAGGCQTWSSKAWESTRWVMSPPDRMLFFPRWLADFKEAGDGKSNADMSKIRPLRQKIWPLGTGWLWLETRLAKSFVIDISGMCSEKGKAKDGSHLRWQTEHNIQKMKSKEIGFSRTKCIKSTGKQLRHDGSNSRSSPIETVNVGQVTSRFPKSSWFQHMGYIVVVVSFCFCNCKRI